MQPYCPWHTQCKPSHYACSVFHSLLSLFIYVPHLPPWVWQVAPHFWPWRMSSVCPTAKRVSCVITPRFPSKCSCHQLKNASHIHLRQCLNMHRLQIKPTLCECWCKMYLQYWWQQSEIQSIAASFHLIHKCDWKHINKCHTSICFWLFQVPPYTYNIIWNPSLHYKSCLANRSLEIKKKILFACVY